MKEMVRANVGFRRWFFFWIGIIATLAYRIIIVLEDSYIKVAWYIGTVGFILYFGHRTHVQKKRAEIVIENDLVKVVDKLRGLSKSQKDALNYLVESSATSKVRWNSLFIFWLSVLALVVGIIVDFVF
jgi:hypothetical protein